MQGFQKKASKACVKAYIGDFWLQDFSGLKEAQEALRRGNTFFEACHPHALPTIVQIVGICLRERRVNAASREFATLIIPGPPEGWLMACRAIKYCDWPPFMLLASQASLPTHLLTQFIL